MPGLPPVVTTEIENKVKEKIPVAENSEVELWDKVYLEQEQVITEVQYTLEDDDYIGYVLHTNTNILSIFPRTHHLVEWLRGRRENVFISHSHRDQRLAQSCVDYLGATLSLADGNKIRASSLAANAGPIGFQISEDLKGFIRKSRVTIVLVTENSLSSSWVPFEMGASWVTGAHTIQILQEDLSKADLPGPMAEYLAIETRGKTQSQIDGELIQASGTVAQLLDVATKSDANSIQKVATFRRNLAPHAPPGDRRGRPDRRRAS